MLILKNFSGEVLNNTAKIFGDYRMLFMLPIKFECMNKEMLRAFQEMADEMQAEEYEIALSIETYPNGNRYFVFDVYGYIGDEEMRDSRQLELAPEDAIYYYCMACRQIADNINSYSNF